MTITLCFWLFFLVVGHLCPYNISRLAIFVPGVLVKLEF